jgi:large subunit ribosomal protein L18
MNKTQQKAERREKVHRRIRRNVSGTAVRPRLAVFKSNRYISVQAIDDAAGQTLAAASSADEALKGRFSKGTCSIEAAKAVGAAIAGKIREKGIESAVFDRGGYLYHGRIKALADGAREAGLKF